MSNRRAAPWLALSRSASDAVHRGTDTSPGDWSGGLDSEVKVSLTTRSTNDKAAVPISTRSFIFGSKLPGVSHLGFTNGRILWEGVLCHHGGNCLKEMFFEENQQEGRAIACSGPICQWGMTGHKAVHRGIGASPGDSKFGGGLHSGFKM